MTETKCSKCGKKMREVLTFIEGKKSNRGTKWKQKAIYACLKCGTRKIV